MVRSEVIVRVRVMVKGDSDGEGKLQGISYEAYSISIPQ